MYFVERGDDIDKVGGLAWHTPLQSALYQHHIECALYLLKHGADVNYAETGNVPLGICTGNGCLDFMRLLIKYGADVNAKAPRRWSPLHEAARRGNKSSLKVLIEAGAEVNAMDYNGVTPLDVCGYDNVRFLLAHGARLNNPGDVSEDEEILKDLEIMRALLSQRYMGEHLRKKCIGKFLLSAISYGYLLSVKMLVEMGDDTEHDLYGCAPTALNMAVTRYGFDSELASYLLEHGANINCVDSHRKTLLERAVACDSLDMLSFLLENGADPGIPTSRGMSLIEYAELLGCGEIVKALKEWNIRAGRKA